MFSIAVSAAAKYAPVIAKVAAPVANQAVAALDISGVDIGLSLAASARVSRVEHVTARVKSDRHVVALVQSTEPGSLWWVQSPVARSSEGEVTAKVLFGNQKTRDGSKFRVLFLLPKTVEEAERYKTGDALQTLPKGMPHSRPVEVVLKK